VTIRARLLLLVFAVWLPAVAGFGLLARTTYLREEELARLGIRQLGRSLALVIESELEKRAVMARTLAASLSLRDSDIPRFVEEASEAARDSGSWVVLVDKTTQLANTSVPNRPQGRPRGEIAPLVTGEPEVYFTPSGPARTGPVVGVFAPELHARPMRYNVCVAFQPQRVQELLSRYTFPDGTIATVLDREQRVMARTRDADKWLGRRASGPALAQMKTQEEGFIDSVTLDGVPSITYLSRPDRYQWTVAIAFPETALAAAARRLTLQAVGAAGALLLVGLALALFAARQITRPVLALRDAAQELGHERVPPELRTGLAEADEVGAALRSAGMRTQEAAHVLERQVDEAVRQAQEVQARLMEAQKREAIGRLTGGVAHDFNNLLQTISVGLQVLERVVTEAGPRRALEGALRACSKAAELVRQMLAFGRTTALQPRPVALDDFLLKMRELTAPAVGARIDLSASVAPGLPPVLADPTQLELALLNLVFNSRDALPQGGSIAILARLASAAEAEGASAGGQFVCLEVRDNGSGMSEAAQARAFDPYFTTKPVGVGSGLGLAQVRGFVSGSGGAVRLVSVPGQGTRVSLILPVAPAGSEDGPAAAPQLAAPMRPLRILMAEDDVLVSALVVPALEGEGHHVTLTRNAQDAMQLLQGPDRFDVLFTDVVMPGPMTGLDLVTWCREHGPGLPAVVATGYTAETIDPASVEVLRKPYEIGALLAALQRATDASASGQRGFTSNM
jgi:signal transduction histidine kinase